MEPYKIHDKMKLGVATASTQIEGGDTNNSFYEFSLIKGRIKDDSTPFVANQHYKLYKEDIKLMSQMHIEIYRMSIEWARIEPEEGVFYSEAMEHYIDEIKLLKEKNIEVLVTLHHFSNPVWFEHKGGFTKAGNLTHFLKYVRYIAENLKGIADEYCTINEPNIYALTSFYEGVWPPAEKSMKLAKEVLRNLANAHIESYRILHEVSPDCRVGFANHMVYFEPKSKRNILDVIQTRYIQRIFQDSIMKAMAFGKKTQFIGSLKQKKGKYYDFIGINYYLRNEVHKFKVSPGKDAPKNDLGWEIFPMGLRKICEREHEIFGGDIYITENGTCDSKDNFRSDYIYSHLKVISDLPYVKAYYHWTFIDNWEWAEGQTAKFGLVHLDYKTQERTVRKSGEMYTRVIDNRGFSEEIIKEYLEK